MIGRRIKQLREEKGYSLTKLANEAHISKSYLSTLESKAMTNPSLRILSQIALALETTLDDLIASEPLRRKKQPALSRKGC
ncbi:MULTISPECIES: helix-turn-helix transcriptional regulator [Bacillaceae]|uniref:helix-turn-helix domain-containing protein n=1 Tax=Bacillaceae TaxID=186817 RepID=UPI000E712BE9|nr:helix-turn-helix transcriptional regulator [Bacillus sp. PK3_68]RJS58691.1 hypothetical protein CJ483_00250 [Bacillus sp. PK3_68]